MSLKDGGAPLKTKRKQYKSIPNDRKAFMKRRSKLRKLIENCSNLRKKDVFKKEIFAIERNIKSSFFKERCKAENFAIGRIKSSPKTFYSFATKKHTVDTSIGPLINDDGVLISGSKKMADVLNNQYNKVFNTSPGSVKVFLDKETSDLNSAFYDTPCIAVNTFFNNTEASLTKINFHRERVEAAIDSLRSGSAAGPDQISAYFLKQTKSYISHCLSIIMQSSFNSSTIPQSLKDAFVIPIPKGGSKSAPSNYRPVSLTSHIIKLIERIIFEDIVSYFQEINYLNDKQHGFRKGFSTMSELLTHYNEIVNSLKSGHPYPSIMLDYSKAFDQVHHSLLLSKIKAVGINGLIGRWLANFLLGRRQCVKIGSLLSDYIDVLSGVPQATILVPLFFSSFYQ